MFARCFFRAIRVSQANYGQHPLGAGVHDRNQVTCNVKTFAVFRILLNPHHTCLLRGITPRVLLPSAPRNIRAGSPCS